MKAVDDFVPTPIRALDKTFSMPIEDVFSIQVCAHTMRFPCTPTVPMHTRSYGITAN